MDKPSGEVIRWYKTQQWRRENNLDYPEQIAVADFLRDERAKRLEAEFHFDHGEFTARFPTRKCCEQCGSKNLDPMHSWTFVDWQALAHLQLTGKET